ncbi:MAG: ATP-binding protein [Verrucomicrobiota bacterium]
MPCLIMVLALLATAGTTPALAAEFLVTMDVQPATGVIDGKGSAIAKEPAFRHRGFYLHGGWFFNYPFAVRTWQREDFANMFHLLRLMGFDQVGIWPMLEAIPMPLSESDAAALREFRQTFEDARSAQLECWLVQCPNLIPSQTIATKPWRQRNPYPVWSKIRLDDPAQAALYLAHRTAMIAILNNADAYVTIDGDPGGYAGAKPDDWLKVFLSDRAALDRYGIDPKRQRLIPWIWCGWGTDGVWVEPIEPFSRAAMELFKSRMPEPWALLPGRSHRDGWANGRINISLADELGLMSRSTIFCYEAIEFEPAPPAAVLQFDLIRRVLKQESKYAKSAAGVFGNAQQPIMVLPNLYFFARGSSDLAYLDTPDDQILRDFAAFLGGPPELLVPAWSCLQRTLDTLPTDLPQRLRSARLLGAPANFIPGGSQRYLDILARQAESRIALLQATARPAASDEQAAERLADGIAALVKWWKTHRYVLSGSGEEAFSWSFVETNQVSLLRNWCSKNVKDFAVVSALAAKRLAIDQVLPEEAVVGDRVQPLVGLISELRSSPAKSIVESLATPLKFVAPEAVTFRYKLEGFDTGWVDTGITRPAYYGGLPPGRYQFRVMMAGVDGTWTEAAPLSVQIVPHIWQTWWFITLCVLTLGGAIGATVWYVGRRNHQRQLALLRLQQAVEAERARIARDIHDDLGASLTQIALLSEMVQSDVAQGDSPSPGQGKKHLNDIFCLAQGLARMVDEIVWAANPKNDTLENFGVYICKFAQDYLRLAGIPCRLDVPDFLPAYSLPSMARHHLYLATKEALHNIVKHAAATEVWLRITADREMLRLMIEDNGRGFGDDFAAPAITQRTALDGDGLANMEKRLQQIGGRFEQFSQPGQGTTTRLALPLTWNRNSISF